MAKTGPEMDLSSFTDIMTCILGVLILIILMTGIDAASITVLIATPKEMTTDDKSPVFFECRKNQLFQVSLEELKKLCDAKTEEIRERVKGDENEFLKQAGQTVMEIDGQRLDYTYALLGKYVLQPNPEAEGYAFVRFMEENDQMWFGSKLAKINPDTQFICFFVRPDSYKIFGQARSLAWVRNIDAACELLDEKDPIMIGPGGDRLYSQ
jgi:hypothetical protein